jgi:hypothetical protein
LKLGPNLIENHDILYIADVALIGNRRLYYI